ncbi:hypothetical protein QFC20_001062 [Naganishia adeliensis]|uniref:Uncharacterized protein n=1 Tax=Naganishia adeliensis TaxID=92952 RepID=A0ACC2WTW1_9TREE|nr:hypothetical protein QFC20_001062 [Naganishia adeliensis]
MAQEYMNNSDTVGPIPEEWNDCNSVTDSICFYPLSDDSPEHSPVHENRFEQEDVEPTKVKEEGKAAKSAMDKVKGKARESQSPTKDDAP